jgi:hypothetical protein
VPDISRARRAAKRDRQLAWWLAWLYPPAFRRDVGLGFVDALDDRMRERRAAGSSSLGVRIPAIADTLRSKKASIFKKAHCCTTSYAARSSQRHNGAANQRGELGFAP